MRSIVLFMHMIDIFYINDYFSTYFRICIKLLDLHAILSCLENILILILSSCANVMNVRKQQTLGRGVINPTSDVYLRGRCVLHVIICEGDMYNTRSRAEEICITHNVMGGRYVLHAISCEDNMYYTRYYAMEICITRDCI